VEERGGGEDGGVHWWTSVLAQLTRAGRPLRLRFLVGGRGCAVGCAG
jgi:hypothetical protein